jgi:hypothetical protein
MRNSFSKPISNSDVRKDVKVLFLRIQILNRNSNSFRQISIFLELSFRINFEIFQTLSSNLFELNPSPIYRFPPLRKFKNFHSNSNSS